MVSLIHYYPEIYKISSNKAKAIDSSKILYPIMSSYFVLIISSGFHMVSLTRYYEGIYEIPSDKAKLTNSSKFLYPIMFCSHH